MEKYEEKNKMTDVNKIMQIFQQNCIFANNMPKN